MDKNIFALVANDLCTVKVRFQQFNRANGRIEFCSDKSYTYVSSLLLKVKDYVAVYIGFGNSLELKVAQVVEVDEGVDITPDAKYEYKFIVSKVDMEDYDYVMGQKNEVEKELAKAYQQKIRKQFAEQFLGGVSKEMMTKLGYEEE